MRPRVFPAEDSFIGKKVWGLLKASMRPRVFPAEDRGAHARKTRRNERLQ